MARTGSVPDDQYGAWFPPLVTRPRTSRWVRLFDLARSLAALVGKRTDGARMRPVFSLRTPWHLSSEREDNHMTNAGKIATLSTAALMAAVAHVTAADVSYERLLSPEPQNWLMNHRDFGSHRYSPLDIINKSNVKNLRLAFALPLGGKAGNEYVEATPLVDNGIMYITDVWGVVYKIDVRSGTEGKIVWKMDPGQQKLDRNRGVALWGNLVISVAGYDGRIIATDAETGQVVWDKKHGDQPDLEFTAAPLALKDTIVIGASGGDNGVRAWLAGLNPKTGEQQWKTFMVPAPGEPGSETWKDKVNAWRTGG